MAASLDTAQSRGSVWVTYLFLISLMTPFYFSVGPLLLMPHRVVILVFFVPFFFKLFVLRKAGKPLLIDWLLFGSALWAGLALAVNHPVSTIVEPFGIHMLEFFGAYLIARVSIRSASDFQRMVRLFFFLVLFLFPFAAAESLTKQPVLLNLLPGNSVGINYSGERFGMRRAQTIFAHPILFGVFVSTGLGLFWYGLRPRGLRFLAAPIVAVSTIFSLSTGALISFVMQSSFIGWETVLKVLRRRWTIFAVLSVTGYFAIDLLSNRTPFHVLVTYATFSTGSAYNRILIWQYGTDNVWANPIFGLGLRDWIRPNWMGASIDNFWLLIGMRYGLPSIAMVMTAMFLILRRVSRVELVTRDENLSRAAYLVAIGGLLIAGGTVHYWHAMQAFVLFIFGSGIWAISGGALTARSEEPTSDEAEPPRRSRYTRQTGIRQPIPGPSRPQTARAASAEPRHRARSVRRP